MKLIVLHTAEFEVPNDISIKDTLIFLRQLGFEDIANFDFGKEAIFCTGEYYGKKQFAMPTIEAPEYYLHFINTRYLNNYEQTSHNAHVLNELCARNGRER